MAVIGSPRCARSTLSTAVSDGGGSHSRRPTVSRPSYSTVSNRWLSTRVTRFSAPPPLRTNVVPAPLSTRGGHTETVAPPDLCCSLRICTDTLRPAGERRYQSQDDSYAPRPGQFHHTHRRIR